MALKVSKALLNKVWLETLLNKVLHKVSLKALLKASLLKASLKASKWSVIAEHQSLSLKASL
jgi:hypothetical protein